MSLSFRKVDEMPDVMIFEPMRFDDERGCFFVSYNSSAFNNAVGFDVCFLQDNCSRSNKGVLRGIHYQVGEAAQGKLVRVSRGAIIDVAVDLRRNSKNFGKHCMIELSAENGRQLWIPKGFGHAFFVISDIADVQYKIDAPWSPKDEVTIRWDDPELNILWPISYGQVPILSDKDRDGVWLKDAVIF